MRGNTTYSWEYVKSCESIVIYCCPFRKKDLFCVAYYYFGIGELAMAFYLWL